MKTPLVMLLAAACLAPLALEAGPDISSRVAGSSTQGHQEPAGQSPVIGGPAGNSGAKAGKISVEIVPEPKVATVLGILGAIVLLRRRA